MGIKNLTKFLKKNAPQGIKMISVVKLKKSIVGIDGNQTIYQYVTAIRNNGNDMKTDDGKITTHLFAVFSKTLTLLSKGIKPFFVFDGKANKLKDKLLKKRKDNKEKAKTKSKKNKDDISAFKMSFHIEKWMIKECMELLELMGIPTMQAQEEADPLCAEMANDEDIDYVQSDDMDLLAFGTPELIATIRQNTDKVTKYNLYTILDKLKLTYEQFVDLCILFGCDYCPTIKGIGQIKAYDLIKEHKNIENILKYLKKEKVKGIEVNDEFKALYKEVRQYFINPKVIHEYDIEWNEPDIGKTIKYLKKKDFNIGILKPRLKKLWEYYCNIFCDVNKRNKLLKKDIFKNINIPAHPLSGGLKIEFNDNAENSDDELCISV
jgi:flap endonuclease-1